MRIVAGRFRGAALIGPKGQEIRPTGDRVRKSLFNILAHGIEGAEIEGARVLDLFAGTGALGLEALSRGAAYVHFVEDNAEARGLIRRNIEALGATGATRIYRRDATKLGPAGTLKPFGLVFRRSALWQGIGRTGAAIGACRGLAAAGGDCGRRRARRRRIRPATRLRACRPAQLRRHHHPLRPRGLVHRTESVRTFPTNPMHKQRPRAQLRAQRSIRL